MTYQIPIFILPFEFCSFVFDGREIMRVFFIFSKMKQHCSFLISHLNFFPNWVSVVSHFKQSLAFKQWENLGSGVFQVFFDQFLYRFIPGILIIDFAKKLFWL